MQGLRIRPLDPKEIPEVVGLWRRSRFDALPEHEAQHGHTLEDETNFFRHVIAPKCLVWVAEHDGELAGLLATFGNEVDRLYVEPTKQRIGVGGALLDFAKAQSPSGLTLFTLQINERARRFYEARGFRAVKFGISPPPESAPDVLYEWPGTEPKSD